MQRTGQSAGEDAAKRDLEELLREAADSLSSKIKRDEAKAEEAAAQQDNQVGGGSQTHGDKGVDVDEMLEAYEKQLKESTVKELAGLSDYKRIRKENLRYVDEMAAEIGNALLRDALPKREGHFRSGVYDAKRAIQSEFRKQATGRGDPNLFLRRAEPKERDTEIVFCIDTSGSMSDMGKMDAAKAATVVFLEALDELNIANAVIAFSYSPVILKHLDKRADESAREAILPLLRPNGGTDDFAALQTAAQMLEKSSANNRIIIFLTDGAGNSRQRKATEDLEQNSGIKVIGIGLGPGTEAVKTTYEHNLFVPNVKQLPRMLSEMLTDELTD